MIRILEGRVGSGKTARILSEITDAVRSGQRALWIVPEQMTLQAEIMLVKALNAPGFMLCEALSPSRLVVRTLEAAGGLAGHTLIDERGRAFALRACLLELEEQLAYYAGCGARPGFVEWLLDVTDELTRNEITSTQLRLCADAMTEQTLQWKLYDLCAVLDRYRQAIEGKYLDSAQAQALFAARAAEVEFIRDARVWVDGFDIMPPQTIRQIVALGGAAREVTVALTAPRELAPDEDDLFAAADICRGRIISFAGQAGVPYIRETLQRQVYHSGEIGHLEAQWDKYGPQPYSEEPRDIHLYAAANPREEAEACASSIFKLAREQGMLYREIAVTAGGLNGYAHYLRRAFAARGIPLFLAADIPSSQHPAARYWLAAMEAATTGFRREAMLRALRSGFAGVTEQQQEALINRQYTYGLWGGGWLAPIEGDEALEQARSVFLAPMLAFRERIRKADTLAEMAEAAYRLLGDAEVYKGLFDDLAHLDDSRPEWAQQNVQIWQSLLNALDQAVELWGDREAPFGHMLLALRSTLDNSALAALPPLPDAVLAADVTRVKGSGIKALFVLGLNDGLLPAAVQSANLLGDRERAQVNAAAATLGLTGRLLNAAEQDQAEKFAIYSAMTLPTHRLYLSYALAEESGSARQPSMLIGHIRAIFPQLTVEKADTGGYDRADMALWTAASRAVRSRGEDEKAIGVWHALSQMPSLAKDAQNILALHISGGEERLPESTAKLLFGENLHMGITRLERYAACPYQHYIVHGIRPMELFPPGIRPLDAGVFYHDVLQGFIERAQSHTDWRQPDSHVLNQYLREACDDALSPILSRQQDSPRLRARINELARVARFSADVLTRQLLHSEFIPFATEMEFGRGKPYPPYPIPLEGGGQILLEGRIDRVDAAELKGERLLRVIDYKSSRRGISQEEMESGLSLQLPLYAHIAAKALSASVAGFFYFTFARKPVKDAPDIERELAKQYKLRGRLLAEPEIALAMDGSMTTSSDVLPVRLTKAGGFYANDPVYTREQMKEQLDSAERTAASLAMRMLAGEIAPVKAKSDACAYCPYSAVCGSGRR